MHFPATAAAAASAAALVLVWYAHASHHRSDLSNNSLYGTLPAAWSNLTALEVFDLSQNALSGPLPPSYGSWDGLQHLQLNDNLLTGPLPGTWSSMHLLEVRGRPGVYVCVCKARLARSLHWPVLACADLDRMSYKPQYCSSAYSTCAPASRLQ